MNQINHGEKCPHFEGLRDAIVIPFTSYNSRLKAEAAYRCSGYCGEVRETCANLINDNRKETETC